MITWFQESKDRIAFWMLFYILIIVAWCFMVLMTIEPEIENGSWLAALCGPAGQISIVRLSFIWMLMMGAMMAPSFQSHIQIHMDIMSRSGQIWPTIQLVFGYLAVWFVLALVGALMQKVLVHFEFVNSSGRSTSLIFNSLLCFVAASYQFSSWKIFSLKRCASPMHYFFQHWADGPIGGLRMGMHLGFWCASCCWALMLLAFVGGAMNVVWMACITALVFLEKYMSEPQMSSRFIGQMLLCLSALMFILWIFLESS